MKLNQYDLDRINSAIADRSNVFYWQTDRKVTPEEAGDIWADRHRYFTDNELLERINRTLGDDKLASLEPLDLDAQTNLGNVNSVRVGTLVSGSEIIIRSHPKGVLNGYFHAESAAAQKAKEAGLPSYSTFAVHDYSGDEDFSFQVIEKLHGTALKKWLDDNPQDENALVKKVGAMMARVHTIKVDGFGPFYNDEARDGTLIGRHATLGESVRAGLDFNLKVLVDKKILKLELVAPIKQLFEDTNPVLDNAESVLVHNDFADWNLLTDGEDVTGILDWDECVASDPITDLACWSTFFDPERMESFLSGYWTVARKPENFVEKFELLRLRYVLSKMTLRTRRYTWSPTEDVREKIEAGKIHLAESLKHFEL